MNVTHRLLQFIKSKDLAVMAFEGLLNVPGRIQSAKQQQRGFNTDVLELISEKYPELNMNWLVSGNGPMILEPHQQLQDVDKMQAEIAELRNDLLNCLRENKRLTSKYSQN